MGRDSFSLDGLWRFTPDLNANGEGLGFHNIDYDDRFWKETPVPGFFEASVGEVDRYEGACWYRRKFSVPSHWRERRVVLRFEGVNYRTQVWLNGRLVGKNRDGFLPFEFEIKDYIRWSDDNFLAVLVDNSHHEGDVPGMHVGWRNYGGILREVSVYSTAQLYIDTFSVVARPEGEGGRLECRLDINNESNKLRRGICEVSLYDSDGKKEMMESEPCRFEIQPGKSKSIALSKNPGKVRPWSPSSPVLYRVKAALKTNTQQRDVIEVRTGFRSVETAEDGLLLNGESIFLTGFNRHEDSPHTAMSTDLEIARKDLEQMKEAGCNFVRLCHYPHHPGEIDICDELGLLTFCEIPLYFWKDREEGRRTNDARMVTAFRQLERLIKRDRNHPSVIFWSVSNETPEQYPEVAEGNRRLVRRARELDPTRLCVHVSNCWKAHPNFDEDDVICINDYPSLKKKLKGVDFNVTDNWRRNINTLRECYPGKPVLVTEFGFCSITGLGGRDFGEDEHARAIEAEFAAFDQPCICGAAIWCWADHPWPAGNFFNGLGTSPYGVLSRGRRRLKPFRTALRYSGQNRA